MFQTRSEQAITSIAFKISNDMNRFFLVVAIGSCFSMGCLAQDKVSGQKTDLERHEVVLDALFASKKAEDRATAADIIAMESQKPSDVELLLKLLVDVHPDVQGRAALSMGAVASDGRVSQSQASQAHAVLKEKVSVSVERALGRWGATEEEIWLAGCQIQALNALYKAYPLISIKGYADWQAATMLPFLIRLVVTRSDHGEKSEETLLGLLTVIDDPPTALRALEAVCDELELAPPQRVADTLRTLARHRLFGEGRPMAVQKARLLLPHVRSLREHSLKAITERFKHQEFEFHLNEVEREAEPLLPR